MKDKICLITGATSGIGKAAALSLASMGFNLILTGRNERRAEKILNEIRNRIGNKNVYFLKADLSSQIEIIELTKGILNTYERLDVLIHNAGARFDSYRESVDGVELTFATNHMGPFMLTALLMDVLKKSPEARIITVSSGAHYGVMNDFRECWQPGTYERKTAYGQSKLANVMFTYELARRLQGFRITANAVDPGGVATNLGRNNGLLPWIRHIAYYALKRELISPRLGADTIVYLATSREVKDVTGQLFHKREPVKSSDVSYDREAAQRLWEMSEKLVDKTMIGDRRPGV